MPKIVGDFSNNKD